MKTKTSLEKAIMSDKLDQWRAEKRRQYIDQKQGNAEVIISLILSLLTLTLASICYIGQ